MKKRRIKRCGSLEERLAQEAQRLREEASMHPENRDRLLLKAQQTDTAVRFVNAWLLSSGLEPPR